MASCSDEGDELYSFDDIDLVIRLLTSDRTSAREPSVPTWEEAAISDLQFYYELLGDRLFDCVTLSEIKYLETRVAFALYGPPQICEKESLENEDKKEKRKDRPQQNSTQENDEQIGYTPKQKEHVEEIVSLIINKQSNGDKILFATIFVVIYIEGCPLIPVPVFRIPKINCKVRRNCEMTFIDAQCRVYNSWKNYLEENVLPKCKCCFPVDGIYKRNPNESGNRVHVDIGDSPACRWTKDTLSKLDAASIAATLGLTVVGLAGLALPLAAPVLAAAAAGGAVTGAYSVGRSIETLADRRSHGQSISVTDTEARNCWLSIGGSVALVRVSSKMTGIIAKIAQKGHVINAATCFTADTLTVSFLAINGLGIANGAWLLYIKQQSQEITFLDVFQLTSSVLFFTNSAMNIQTARSLIANVQNDTLNQFRQSLRSNRHRRAFDKLARNTRSGMDSMEGNAKVIKGITHIGDKDSFFAGVVRSGKQFGLNKAQTTFTENGKMGINNQMKVDPMGFSKISKHDRNVILTASKKVQDGTFTKAEFHKLIKPIFKENNIPFNLESAETLQNFCNIFGTISLNDFVICGKNILSNMSVTYYKRLEEILQNIDYKRVFRFATEMANKMNCNTAGEFFEFMEFACPYFAEIFKKFWHAYNTIMEIQKSLTGNFKEENFSLDFLNRFYQLLRNIYAGAAKFREFWEEYNDFRANRNRRNMGENNAEYKTNSNEYEEVYKNPKCGLYSIASERALDFGAINTPEYFDFMEFAFPYLEKEYDKMEEHYQKQSPLLETHAGDQFESCSKRDRRKKFVNILRKKYLSRIIADEMKEKYMKFKEKYQRKSFSTFCHDTSEATIESKDDLNINNIANSVAKKLGFHNNTDFIIFTTSHFEKLYKDMERAFQNWLSIVSEPNKSIKELEMACGITGSRKEYFILKIKNMYGSKEKLEELQKEYACYISFITDDAEEAENGNESKEMNVSAGGIQEHISVVPAEQQDVFVVRRDFRTLGKLNTSEYYSIAEQVLGMVVYEDNASILHDENVTFVTVASKYSVVITSNFANNTVKTYVVPLEQ